LESLKFLWDNFKIVHRDIKPPNIYITKDLKVILLDFGLVRRLMSSFSGETKAGTLNYQAPEYFRKEKISRDSKTDCYSLGLILHYLCAQSDAF